MPNKIELEDVSSHEEKSLSFSFQYFQLINASKKVYIDISEKFYKQTYRNRCRIRGANKIDQLIIPVLTASKGKALKDIRIDYNQTWLKDHTRGIMSSYARSPFYEHFAYLFEEIILSKHEFLAELNKTLLTLCLQLTQIDTEIIFIENYSEIQEDNLFNARGLIHPKKHFDTFDNNSYTQVFGNEFESNLSIIDLLFCEGQNSISFL